METRALPGDPPRGTDLPHGPLDLLDPPYRPGSLTAGSQSGTDSSGSTYGLRDADHTLGDWCAAAATTDSRGDLASLALLAVIGTFGSLPDMSRPSPIIIGDVSAPAALFSLVLLSLWIFSCIFALLTKFGRCRLAALTQFPYYDSRGSPPESGGQLWPYSSLQLIPRFRRPYPQCVQWWWNERRHPGSWAGEGCPPRSSFAHGAHYGIVEYCTYRPCG
ncbi:hypothetical protein B0H17DRAFT_1241615 [Mycena rosella]|uniref:Uncharacterized protein n=1 Tax=Mycena rosella TaxID=1033263 RepID=A0AAD7D1C6_MYCRO|nr:hypothetical protein B0H17DRAFT_1241615 [Mycena rosella]